MREAHTEVKVTGPLTLDDLRWLVAQTSDLDGESPVTVQGRKERGQMDGPDPETITVRVTAAREAQ